MRLRWIALAAAAVFIGAPVLAQENIAPAPAAQPSKAAAPDAAPTAGSMPGTPAKEARPPIIPTSAFAMHEKYRAASLSPDGNFIAVEMVLEGSPNIVLFDAVTRQPVQRFTVGTKVGLEWFRWAGNDKLLVSLSKSDNYFGTDALFTRLYVIDRLTSDFNFVGIKAPILTGDDVIYTAPDGSYVLLNLQATPYETPSVFRFELDDPGSGKRIEKPRFNVWDYFADSTGVVRVASGWNNDRLTVYYRKAGSRTMELIGRLKSDETEADIWDVAYINPGSDLGYVLERGESGRVELQSYDFSRRQKVETVYANPDWDLDLAMVRKDGAPLAAFFTDDRDRVVWLDQENQRLQKELDSVLKEDEVWITSRARDDSRMLVYAGGEADPGAMYIYTPAAKQIAIFSELRTKLRPADLVKPRPVHYDARDGTRITAYLTLPRGRDAANLPLILLPHGGPYGVRDQLRYDDEVQLLANRGYAVLQPNYRGSAGYGTKFTQLGTGQIGRKMQDDIDDAMDWAVTQGIADPARVCVVGGSYGGYAALWAVVRNPERYRCAASWAGVTDWNSQLKYDRNFFSRSGGKSWRRRVEGSDDGFDLDSVSPYRQAARLTRPTLLAHGTDDSNVPFSQFSKMRSAAESAGAPVQLLVIEGEGHSFSKPENKQQWYDTLVAFLAAHNPPD